MPKTQDPGFEESLASLEAIVDQLERGELPLEKALSLFQEGVTLAGRCQRQLEEVQRKVEILTRERGEIKSVPFEPPREIQNGETAAIRPTASTGPAKRTGEDDPFLDEDPDEDLNDDAPF